MDATPDTIIPYAERDQNSEKADLWLNKLRKLPKNSLLVGLIAVIFLGLLGGIYIMDNNATRKVKSIILKAPFRSAPTSVPLLTLVPTKDPTQNWLSYSNKSFSIKYPSRFSVTEKEFSYTVLYP